jgi:uncharacterized protein (DUF3084 family)
MTPLPFGVQAMSESINFEQRLELRNASGTTLGYFVPNDTIHSLLTERDSLHQELTRLQKELAALRKEKEEVETERNAYQQSLQALLKEDFTFTEEEILDLQQNGIPFEQVIAEVEKIVSQGHRSNGNG